MSPSISSLGNLSIFPPEIRYMVYEELVPTKINVNIISAAYNPTTQLLASPLDNLASTNKTFQAELERWYEHTQRAKSRFPELTRNISLGLGIHNPSTVTFYVSFRDFLNTNKDNAVVNYNDKFAEFAKRLEEFSQTNNLPEITKLTVLPHIHAPLPIDQTTEESEANDRFYHSLQFAMFKRILATLAKIMEVRVYFPSPAPSSSRAHQLALVNAVKHWNLTRHFCLDGRGEDYDQEIEVEMFVSGIKHGIENGISEEELPFSRDEQGRVTEEVDCEDLLGRQCWALSGEEEEALFCEWRLAEEVVSGEAMEVVEVVEG